MTGYNFFIIGGWLPDEAALSAFVPLAAMEWFAAVGTPAEGGEVEKDNHDKAKDDE